MIRLIMLPLLHLLILCMIRIVNVNLMINRMLNFLNILLLSINA